MILLIIPLIITLNTPTKVTCSATSFGRPGDKHGGRTPTLLYKRPVGPKDFGLAHRTWPLGARVKITNTRNGKSSIGVVLDRGTYGMRDSKGWFNSKKRFKSKARTKLNRLRAKKLLLEKGEAAYCGCGDLTYPTADKIGHRGRNEVELELLGLSK